MNQPDSSRVCTTKTQLEKLVMDITSHDLNLQMQQLISEYKKTGNEHYKLDAEYLRSEFDTWWNDEVYRPGLLVATRVATPRSLISGDAPVNASVASSSTSIVPFNASNNKQNNKQNNGNQRNRQGKPICAAFNNGTCTGTGRGNTCPLDSNVMHQCSRCLATGHPAISCPNAQNNNKKRNGKGNNKGGKNGRNTKQKTA